MSHRHYQMEMGQLNLITVIVMTRNDVIVIVMTYDDDIMQGNPACPHSLQWCPSKSKLSSEILRDIFFH